MIRPGLLHIGLLTFVLGACHVGPQIETLRFPVKPAGANVMVKLARNVALEVTEYQGELLEATATGLLLAQSNGSSNTIRVIFVPWRIIRDAQATATASVRSKIRNKGQTHEAALDEFRLVSRFPQGLSDELRATLLANFGQIEALVIGSGS